LAGAVNQQINRGSLAAQSRNQTGDIFVSCQIALDASHLSRRCPGTFNNLLQTGLVSANEPYHHSLRRKR
jgi:hypothetical protein